MQDLSRSFYTLAFVFLILGLILNLYPNLPRIPGDININKPGIKIYIPVVSSIIVSILLTFLLNSLRK
ncbi:hypothetical protein A3A14_02035 [Candidatus Daviesbacteria bacterium RIFCSPLOWO2_01_FULL_43_38]|uniref:DUF2905 domain-containing protein n=1 Tax=Candidatus Daviesbacteria bacterium RIFCSPHIGHO2_12_FULL_43_11 TaxID=1797780 RepID=A0A1F5K7Q5_9BACT|nr:MAG: hypothetical protein A2874_02795 [Candidatus Daviesbacteria bacterium RIFCSPHIGHO2_01_FULL_43_17]OGE36976.1 MAG: hypothetical protein A3E45_01910 [Candidatus Daviesbacteria bacterium RIFCSPHIGHO2_12_FULL_43_11]OGE63633.1 MAG: hypothetical protein A3A14_02035 [Candidatus Daviesbacteria bacterium RIFCSPLOWO2_01_FULL_43_38]